MAAWDGSESTDSVLRPSGPPDRTVGDPARLSADRDGLPGMADRVLRWFWVAQAALVTGWWLILWWSPAARGWFGFGDWPEAVLLAFVVPDGVVLVAGSALAARAVGPRRLVLAWLVTGGCWYACLWCLSASLASGGGWLGCVAMAGMAFANLAAARTAGHRAEAA